jgi:hypothetical protein
MAWGVSTADVLATTGASATTAQIAAADSIVTIYVNRDSSASGSMAPRDLASIKAAVAWQAAWMLSQPNLAGRSQFDNLSQDGLSVSSSAEWAKILSPIAARSLKNLTWKGSRTLRTPNVSVPTGLGADFVLETSDGWSRWEEL